MKLNTIEGESTRPTKDMVKEALFSILAEKVYDSTFLDLFAGSGACGIEALSRGAKIAYFCDNNTDCIKIISQNLEKAKLTEQALIYNKNYDIFLKSLEDVSFDIIYVDPPYNKGLGIEAIKIISSYNLLKKTGIIVYETDEIEQVPDIIGNYERFKMKKYGRNILNFYSWKG